MKRANIANYESGRSVPQPETLIKLADIFSKSVDFLLCRDIPGGDPGGIDELGRAIRSERMKQGLSQQQLADIVGVHQSVISQYERDLVEVPEVIAEKIAKVFGYSLAAFMTEYDLLHIDIHPEFEGDVDKQIAYNEALQEDLQREYELEMNKQNDINVLTLAAHQIGHKGELTPEQLAQIKLALKIALAEDN